MPQVVDLLRPTWLTGINDVERGRAGGIATWVESGSYYLSSVRSPDEFVLSYSDAAELAAAFASDVDRLACAAVESAVSCVTVPRLPRSSAWLTIKMYYGAFFAAHALCRIAGRSFSKLDHDDLVRLNVLLSAPGIGVTARSGYYYCVVASTNETKLQNAGAIRGTHAATWQQFVGYLEDVINASAAVPSTLQPALASLMSLRE